MWSSSMFIVKALDSELWNLIQQIVFGSLSDSPILVIFQYMFIGQMSGKLYFNL